MSKRNLPANYKVVMDQSEKHPFGFMARAMTEDNEPIHGKDGYMLTSGDWFFSADEAIAKLQEKLAPLIQEDDVIP